MKRFLITLFVSFLAIGFSIDDAEARRFGGGRSFGMQRQAAPKPAPNTPRQANPSQTAGKPAASPNRSWLGPLGGLAAGLGLAALLSHFGLGEGMADLLLLALFAFVGIAIFKRLFARPAAATASASGAGTNSYARTDFSSTAFTPVNSQTGSSSSAPQAGNIPQDFDVEGFLRVAKLNFVRLQAANDEGNMADIREFVAPEVFAEIKVQMEERGKEAQQTDVVTLNAELLEVVTEGEKHIASVHFSGMIREEKDGAAEPFEEVWNLSKPINGSQGWVISGIQQL